MTRLAEIPRENNNNVNLTNIFTSESITMTANDFVNKKDHFVIWIFVIFFLSKNFTSLALTTRTRTTSLVVLSVNGEKLKEILLIFTKKSLTFNYLFNFDKNLTLLLTSILTCKDQFGPKKKNCDGKFFFIKKTKFVKFINHLQPSKLLFE